MPKVTQQVIAGGQSRIGQHSREDQTGPIVAIRNFEGTPFRILLQPQRIVMIIVTCSCSFSNSRVALTQCFLKNYPSYLDIFILENYFIRRNVNNVKHRTRDNVVLHLIYLSFHTRGYMVGAAEPWAVRRLSLNLYFSSWAFKNVQMRYFKSHCKIRENAFVWGTFTNPTEANIPGAMIKKSTHAYPCRCLQILHIFPMKHFMFILST